MTSSVHIVIYISRDASTSRHDGDSLEAYIRVYCT